MDSTECGSVIMYPLNASTCNLTTKAVKSYSSDQWSMLDITIELYVITLLCIIGIFGNIVSFVVLQRDNERRESLMLLQALAVADGCYLVVALLRYPMVHFVSESMHASMQLVVYPLMKAAQTAAVWMMVLVTVDRYIYVCMPLRAHDVFTIRNRRLFAVAVFLVALLFTLPRFFDSCLLFYLYVCDGSQRPAMVQRPEFIHSYYKEVYQFGAFIVFVYLGPLSMLTVFNCKLIRTIHRSKQRQLEMHRRPMAKGSHYSETNANLVLVIVVVIFIICETPEMILTIWRNVSFHLGNRKFSTAEYFFLHVCTKISELLMVINSSTNFVVYCAFGSRFRFVMRETFKQLSSNTNISQVPETVPLHRNNHLVNQQAYCPHDMLLQPQGDAQGNNDKPRG